MVEQPTQTIDGPDITNYWQYFNLDRDPFSMAFDEALTYVPTSWEEMLDLVQYLIHYKNELVVITGATGIGKSLFGELLINQLGDTAHIAKIAAEANFSLVRLIEFLSDSFIVPWKPEQTVEDALDSQLEAFQHKEKPCLLIIDNAHLLPAETLEALLYLIEQQSENQMRFHVLLLGEPALIVNLRGMLDNEEESLVHFLAIEPLTAEETQHYLNYRLSAAGWQNESPITEETVTRIYRLAEGNPARINRIARRFLLDTLNEQDEGKGIDWRKQLTRVVGGLILLALIAGAAVWFWQNNATNKNTDSQPVVQSNGQPNVTLNGQPMTPEVKAGQTVNLPTPAAAAIPGTMANPPTQVADPVAMPPATAVTTTQPVSVPAPSITAGNQIAAVPVPIPSTPAATNAPTAVNSKVDNAALSASAPTSTPAAVASINNKQAEAAKPVKTEEATAETSSAKPAVVHEASTHQPAHKKAKSAVKLAANNHPAKEEYSIQLIGLSKQASLAKFIKDNHLEGKITTKTINHHGKKMTVVLYGRYTSLHEAEQAMTTLPASLQTAKPWPRKIAE